MFKKIFWLVILFAIGYVLCYLFIYKDEDIKITIRPAALWEKLKDRILDKDLPVQKIINSVEIDIDDISLKKPIIEKKTVQEKAHPLKEYTKDDQKIIGKIIERLE